MSNSLSDFLISLAESPAAVDAFKADPDGKMAAAGLSDDEKAAIKSGDLQKVRAMAGGDIDAAFVVIIIL